MAGPKAMSSNAEQVANDVVNREESLGLCHRFEAPHLPLALPGRLVGDFNPVVEPDRVADNRWREPVAWIVRDIVGHLVTVPAVASS